MFGAEIKARVKQNSPEFKDFCSSCKHKGDIDTCINCSMLRLNDNKKEPSKYRKEARK